MPCMCIKMQCRNSTGNLNCNVSYTSVLYFKGFTLLLACCPGICGILFVVKQVGRRKSLGELAIGAAVAVVTDIFK